MSAFWRDRPVLVTGATGLVGSWLVPALRARGASVVALVRDWEPDSLLVTSGTLDRVRVVRGDVVDQPLLERLLGEYEVRTVFHLAAQTVVGTANRNPVGTFESNVRGTWSVLEACRRSPGVEGVVVASSDKAYGEAATLPYDEDTPLRGRHPYDVSKSCADLVAQSYAHTYGSPVLVTRCGNFFGGGDLNWSRLVPGTVRSLIRGEVPVVRSDGTLVRDYLYVEDGAEAYVFLAERLAEDPALAGRAFNVSYELRLTVLAMVERIGRAFGCEVAPKVLSEPVREIREQSLSAARVRDELGWLPRFTLDEGLRRTVAWYREHLASAR